MNGGDYNVSGCMLRWTNEFIPLDMAERKDVHRRTRVAMHLHVMMVSEKIDRRAHSPTGHGPVV
jgi:hypothetical protein